KCAVALLRTESDVRHLGEREQTVEARSRVAFGEAVRRDLDEQTPRHETVGLAGNRGRAGVWIDWAHVGAGRRAERERDDDGNHRGNVLHVSLARPRPS